jgi:CheY-like chemotaxis protein
VLHDHLQQLLVGARMSLNLASREAKDPRARKLIRSADGLLGESLEASRSLTVELSPPILHDAGLRPALEWLARWMGERHGLAVEVVKDGWAEPDSEDVRVLIFQAVRELLFNVVKHAKVGRAQVEIGHEGGRVQVSVIDEGPGFDPAKPDDGRDVPRAFGLFSIRERLEALGGVLEIDSRPGEGARVTVLAPLAPMVDADATAGEAGTGAAGDRSSPTPAGGRSGGGRRIRVLLADDHEVVRDGLASLLSHEPDVEVVAEAPDGTAALEMARRTQPDVVIMDVSMPGLNGPEATRHILRDLPAVRVIALSTYEEEDMASRMLEAGATAYLTKGGPAEALIAAIRAAAVPDAQPDAGKV